MSLPLGALVSNRAASNYAVRVRARAVSYLFCIPVSVPIDTPNSSSIRNAISGKRRAAVSERPTARTL